MGDEEIVARYSTAGVWQQTIDLAGTWSEGTGNGLAFDGTDLWLVGNGTDQLRRYTTAGSHEQTINLPSSADHRGIAHYSGRLYVVDTTNSQLLIFSTDGDALGTIDVSGAVSAPTGVWISPLGTLYVSKDGDGIYRRQTEVS